MTAQHPAIRPTQPHQMVKRAWGLLALRLILVAALIAVIWWVLQYTTDITSFPPSIMWATLGLLPVNIVCLIVVRKLYRDQGLTLRQAMGIQRGRIAKDIGWGVLWLMVLNVPFIIAVSGTVLIMYGTQAPEAFATIFINPDGLIMMSPVVLLVIALIAVIPFMVLNAPVEELVFRGYGMAGIQHRLGRTGAIVATSVVFGIQHIFFAATPAGMIVYWVAFTVWGMIAGIIVTRQGRLFPVIIAHWMINILLSAPAIVLPVLMLTGVIE